MIVRRRNATTHQQWGPLSVTQELHPVGEWCQRLRACVFFWRRIFWAHAV